MQIEWFVYHKNSVLGPFSTEDVKSQISANKFDPETVIWWKGEKDWIPLDIWQKDYPSIITRLEGHYNTEWKIKTNSETTDFMSFDMCLEYLKLVDLKTGVDLCKKGGTKDVWENIFTNSIFLNALEMTRRKFPRVPVVATAKISKLNSKFSYLVKLNIIGEGGIGVSGLVKNFPTNVELSIKIEGPNFSTPIFAEGHIVYHTSDGASGIEFDKITAECQSSIIDYVKQFQTLKQVTTKKAA